MPHLVPFLFAAFLFVLPCLGLAGCATAPDVPAVTAAGSEGVEVAREHLEVVLAAIEEADRALDVAPKLHDAVVAARSSYDAERYSEAAGHLRTAVQAATDAGYKVPPNVVEDLGLAELAMRRAGL